MSKNIIGIVQDGLGQGAEFTQLDWVRAQVWSKFGFDPYPGTLNIYVDDIATLDNWRMQPGTELEPASGFCSARCYRIVLNDSIVGIWVIPNVPDYPINLVEVMAPVALRQLLCVKSGDRVRIAIVKDVA